jgi:formylglycine-generating enzyme required for sulfatase activity
MEIAEPYRIAKYPVTNAQFQSFIDDADGFTNPTWWAGVHGDGRDQQLKGSADPRWSSPDHARENISWYDAVAFCAWITEKLGYAITLPTETQWERGARGKCGLFYPYGNEFDALKCNTKEAGIGRTTPVDCYPTGASPNEVMNLCGNVWEWTLSEYASRKSDNLMSDFPRVLRGGSFISVSDFARADSRNADIPDYRGDNCGFRLVSPASSP